MQKNKKQGGNSMSYRRKKQVLYLVSIIALWLIVFFFGVEVFSFLGRTVVYFAAIVAVTLLLIEAAVIIGKDIDIEKSKIWRHVFNFIQTIKMSFKEFKQHYLKRVFTNYDTDPSEEEGEAIQPNERLEER